MRTSVSDIEGQRDVLHHLKATRSCLCSQVPSYRHPTLRVSTKSCAMINDIKLTI